MLWLVAWYWWETFLQYSAKVWVLIKRNVISALDNYLMPPYTFPEFAYWKWKNLSLNSAIFFLTKSDRISLETSWVLKFEIWRVSVSINCNFLRLLNQVSHRNNQLLPFLKFLTWYEAWYLSSDITLWISTNLPLTDQVIFDTWIILKMISNLQTTHFLPWAKWCHLLSPFVKGYHWT